MRGRSLNSVGSRPARPRPTRVWRAGRSALVGVTLLASLAGCNDGPQYDIRSEINIVVRRRDALVPPAMKRLAAYGRAALPQIETALHTAATRGRLNLIRALEMIGDDEAVPILRHIAVYDVRSEVRDACEDLLRRWAGAGGPRGARAQAALARVQDKRNKGEAPVIFGETGTPGAPSTVGAPTRIGENPDDHGSP